MTRKRQKIGNTAWLGLILLTMIFPWFGFSRGVQEIRGIELLGNPLLLLSVLLIPVSLALSQEKPVKILGLVSFCGIFLVELYYFFTWYIQTITGEFSLATSFRGVYPEFYMALGVVCIAILFNFFLLFRNWKGEK